MKRSVRLLFLILIFIPAMALFLVGRYERSILRARQATYKQDLLILQQAVNQYIHDNHQPPKSMQELVKAHYLSAIPKVPFDPEIDMTSVLGDPVLSPNLSVFKLPHVK
jgi:hypothetical protein